MDKEQVQHYDATDEVNQYGEYMKLGGSPVSGITLRQVLRGHTGIINRIAWSPSGTHLATPSNDGFIYIWDIERADSFQLLQGSFSTVWNVAWSPDGRTLASASRNNNICLWRIDIDTPWHMLVGHLAEVLCVAWSPNGQFLASASNDRTVRLWDIRNPRKARNSIWLKNLVTSLAWSPDSQYLATASDVSAIYLWELKSGKQLMRFDGHSDLVTSIAWLPDSQHLVSTSSDKTIRIWNISDNKAKKVLEGHASAVNCVSISADGSWMATKSCDKTIRLWQCGTWKQIALLKEMSSNYSNYWLPGLAINPRAQVLATLAENDKAIRVWEINYDSLLNSIPNYASIHYTTAKLVLVGDSGVGKTGLGWRMAHNEFKEHSSTHGQQFWVVPELKKTRDDGTECEAVLWDLAGQPDYRLVHSLYLDDVDTALVLFDPTNRQEPLSGVEFWLNQLKYKDKKLRNAILVGARADRGISTLTNTEIQDYCERNGISGGYIPTSALKGDGLIELVEKLKNQIPWEQMTTTVTTITFKKIKEFVLLLKEKTDQKNVLVQPDQLREQLQTTDKDWDFSDAEMMTAVGHLATHGYVKVIHNSNGQHSILLAPDVLVNLASSIVLEARRNPRGLGVLEEERLLRGEYPFPELTNLSKEESRILLDAVTVLFLEHNLCFRETFNSQAFLVFPSLINEKHPIDENVRIEEGTSYRVKGAIENIYASLVVLLGYTNTFTRINQWQNQAQYEMGKKEICGFIQSEHRNGEIELMLYYDKNTPDPVRLTFRGLFEHFLTRRELEISRYQPVTCHKCNSPLARNVVMEQLSKGKDFSFCHDCGEKLHLPSPERVSRQSRHEEIIMDLQQAIAQRRTAFEAALVHVKGLLRDQGREKAPSCFISYAWGVPEHEHWVVQFAKDLRNAGVDVLLDRWHSLPGSDLGRYIDQIMKSSFVVVVGTPQLLKKYETQVSDAVVAAELRLINVRLREPSAYGQTVIPLLLDGDIRSSFIPMLQTLVRVDFKQSAFYFRQLFDLIWQIFSLPRDNPLLEELQASMTPQERS